MSLLTYDALEFDFAGRSVRLRAAGAWSPEGEIFDGPEGLAKLLRAIGEPVYVGIRDGVLICGHSGDARLGESPSGESVPLVAYVPAVNPAQLGDPSFREDFGIRYNYVAGAMANGIASVGLVEAFARGGMLSFFGAAGLDPSTVEGAVDELQARLGDIPFGVNLIHSPSESSTEEAVVELLIRRGVRLVEASAYLALTPAVVKYRLHGIHRDTSGRVVAPNRVVAKVSRTEVATRFMSPAPEKILAKLLERGDITPEQAALAQEVPVARDITAEADSGGHTDHRPAISLLPTLLALRDQMQEQYRYAEPLRVGLGGGISTPASAAGALAMGAAYILSGTINQACVESGSSDTVRKMLAEAQQADVARAPAADMFEMGVTVQVLKRGTMFSMRGGKLYELYRAHKSLDEVPAAEREKLETQVFRAPLAEIWRQTEQFFHERDPKQVERAHKDPRHKMALVFRWYLGQSSRWANRGETGREMDYQVWCGPAMGAFNEWTKGTFLESPENRRVVNVAQNILYGACVLQRVNVLRAQGVPAPTGADRVPVMRPEELAPFFEIE